MNSKTIQVKKNIIERHSPIGKTDYLSIQHIERYKFALDYLEAGMKVLDIACGSGYGTAMMVRHGCDVTGGDYDTEAINRARDVWEYDDFKEANALDLPFSDNAFDAVVTFETIEHVYENEADQFLKEMKRVLKPGGIFICSTPNVDYTFHPAFHLREYKADEYFQIIKRHFERFDEYGQYFRFLDRLRDLYLRELLFPFINKIKRYVKQRSTSSQFYKRLEKIILGGHHSAVYPKNEISIENWLSNVMNEGKNALYKVVPYKGQKWCRIMIVVSRNGE